MAQEFDLSPWTATPSSTRVSRFRYDHHNRALQVQWRNQANNGYIYENMSYEEYRQFARAASKGRKVNSFLNAFEYRQMSEDEWTAPSSTTRKGLQSRVRG